MSSGIAALFVSRVHNRILKTGENIVRLKLVYTIGLPGL